MTTSNRLFRNIWTIYMATAQSPIFLLLRITQLLMYCKSTIYFTTGNRFHNCLLCIEKLYDKFKSRTCIEKFMWTSNRLFGNISMIQMASAQSPILGYCASIIFLLRISLLFLYCKSSNYFNTANRLIISLLCIEKFYDNLKSSISKYFDDLYDNCAKPNFVATAHP